MATKLALQRGQMLVAESVLGWDFGLAMVMEVELEQGSVVELVLQKEVTSAQSLEVDWKLESAKSW